MINNNILYIDLQNYINVKEFDILHPEICRGIATARHLAFEGSQKINKGTINSAAQGKKVDPLYSVFELYESLSEDHPIKKASKDLDYNQLSIFLKYALGGYDLYTFYRILSVGFNENGIGEIENHFPNLVNWIKDFEKSGMFKSLHSATLMVLEAGGIPWEHCDPEPAREGDVAEFIHIKTDLLRPFYMVHPSTKERVYVNTRVAWWDETDWHGGEPIDRPTYTLRINGRFNDDFKERIINDTLQKN